MALSASITNPIPNNNEYSSSFFSVPDGSTSITISVKADQDLTLKLYQSFDDENYDNVEDRNYTASDDNQFNFSKNGTSAFFTLENTSGTDCTVTRAFSDYKNASSDATIVGTVNTTDTVTHTKLDSIDSNVQTVTSTLLGGIGVTNTSFDFLGDIDTKVLNVDSNIQVNGNKLDAIDSNVQAVNATLGGTLFTSDISANFKLTAIDSNIQVNGDKLDAIDSNIQAVNSTLGGSLVVSQATAANLKTDANITNSYINIQIPRRLFNPILQAVVNDVRQTGSVMVASAIYLHGFEVMTQLPNKSVVGLYDKSTAPVAADSAKVTIYNNDTRSLNIRTFPPGGEMLFSNGIGVRAQGDTGVLSLSQNDPVSANNVYATIYYSEF